MHTVASVLWRLRPQASYEFVPPCQRLIHYFATLYTKHCAGRSLGIPHCLQQPGEHDMRYCNYMTYVTSWFEDCLVGQQDRQSAIPMLHVLPQPCT